jgi:hypothetical protein
VSPTAKRLSAAWLVIAILLAIGSVAGGDTSIVAGFLWLAWTAPIGLIWQFWLYEPLWRLLGTGVTNWLGLLLVIVGAYLFWFVLVPAMFRTAKNRARTN